MSEQELDSTAELEEALRALFHSPQPAPGFVDRLSKKLAERVPSEEKHSWWREGVLSLPRSIGWLSAGLVLILLISWAIRTLPSRIETGAGISIASRTAPVESHPILPVNTPVPTLTVSTPIITSSPVTTPEPTSTAEPTSMLAPSGQIFLPHQKIVWLASDENNLYWYSGDEHIYRQSWKGNPDSQAEIIATSGYPNGYLGSLPGISNGKWLVFLDSASQDRWTLRALNLSDGSDQTLLKSENTFMLRDFSLDADWVALSMFDSTSHKKCQNETVLTMIDLTKNEWKEIKRSCFETEENWVNVSLSGEQFIAVNFAATGGTQSGVFLFNLSDGSFQLLSQSKNLPFQFNPGQNIAFSFPWMAWDGDNTHLVYNEQTEEKIYLSPTNETGAFGGPKINGHWVYWVYSEKAAVFNLGNHQWLILAQPGENERINHVAVGGNLVAWVREQQVDENTANSVIEWQELAPAPASNMLKSTAKVTISPSLTPTSVVSNTLQSTSVPFHTPATSAAFPPDIYPTPSPFVTPVAWPGMSGCPNSAGLEKADQLPPDVALSIMRTIFNGDFDAKRRVSDPILWSNRSLFNNPLEPLQIEANWLDIQPANQTPYKSLISIGCGQPILEYSWWVKMCMAPCQAATSSALMSHYYLIRRYGTWLVWARY
ncbi:MAG: hypothetical protein ACM3PY_06985 [Omnitrophica WOR_2 bacterium]